MDPITSSGGATVVVAIIVAVGVMSRRLRKRRLAGSQALPLAVVAASGLLIVGAALAVAGGVFG